MSPSPRYVALKEQIARLRRDLLPAAFEPTGNYSDTQNTRTIAFRVLAHAEIEAFVEDRVEEAAAAALRGWAKSGISRRCLLALLAFSARDGEGPPSSLAAPQPSKVKEWPEKLELNERIRRIGATFFALIKRNHGIKEENLLALLLPIGVGASSLDPVWVADMTSFGELRGEAAHKSLAGRTVQQPDPKAELERVEGLVLGLEGVDELISALSS
jgi:hypothetical protein